MDGSVLFSIYIFLALFIAWVWVDYFRLIDVFEKENLFRVGLTFLLGAGSVFIVFGIHALWNIPFGLTMEGTFWNDFLYCIFSIGLIEEFAKSIPVIITLLLFRKYINEPVDYIATFSVSALGFAAAENVMYFSDYGAEIISSRAILSAVGHMLFASLTAYGVVLVKFRNIKPGFLIIPLFLLFASVFHGIYDMGLMYAEAGWFGTIITIVFFFLGVSVFSTILNNSLNISPFFSYKHVVHSSHVALRLLLYYTIIFVIQCAVMLIMTDIETVVAHVYSHSYTIVPIVMITVVRLSRFKLIKGRWNLVKPELPFTFSFGGNNRLGFGLHIKGDPYSDYQVNKHFESYMLLCPLRRDSSYLGHCRKAYIFRKLYINGDVAHYAARIFTDDSMQQSKSVLLQLKRQGTVNANEYPIVAILDVANAEELDTSNVPVHAPFIEWAFMKPAPDMQGVKV